LWKSACRKESQKDDTTSCYTTPTQKENIKGPVDFLPNHHIIDILSILKKNGSPHGANGSPHGAIHHPKTEKEKRKRKRKKRMVHTAWYTPPHKG
jgi:hypothetical protein